MKTLTVIQPWATWIVNGIKDVENRTWKTNYRGRILIHAAVNQKLDKSPLDIVHTKPELEVLYSNYTEHELISRLGPFGAIIGSVEIVDCVKEHPSVWAEPDKWHWVLSNAIRFPEPIPTRGKLSLWEYPQILAETEEPGGNLFCHCQLPVSDDVQVSTMFDHFTCRYCGGRWYK
jgi:hypothetical protein